MTTKRTGAMATDTLEDPTVVEPPKPAPTPEPEPTPPVVENDEAVDLNEAVFPGGPSWATIEEWKGQFGDVYITSFTADSHVVWRTLTRFEYKRLIKNMEQAISTGQVTQAEANFNNEELMCEMCCLFPKMTKAEMSGEQAGIASIISQEIMEASGFVAQDVRQL